MTRLILAAALAAAVLAGPAARADTVHLVNGRQITDCVILKETPTVVVVRVATGILTFPRSQVAYVEKSEQKLEFKSWDELAREKPVGGGSAAGGDAAAGAAEAKDEDPDAVPEDLRERAAAIMARMASDDSAEREAAQAEMARLGPKIVPALVDGLRDSRARVRRGCAAALRRLRATGAIKPLIEELVAGTPGKGSEVPRDSVYYLEAVSRALDGIAGKTVNYNPRRESRFGKLQTWVDWWNSNWKRFPRQVGEPVLDEEAEDYEEQLRKAKEIEYGGAAAGSAAP
jgi:hypothetical protein